MAQSIADAMKPEDVRSQAAPEYVTAQRKVLKRLISFLFLLYVVAFLDRINFGFAAIAMNRDLGLSAAAFGLAGTIMYVGYFAFEVPSNMLLVRFGARRWIARIMITWGIASAATAAASGVYSIYLARFVVGLAEGGFLPGILLYLTYWIPAKQRGKATSLFMIAQPIAIGFGSMLSGALMAGLGGSLGLAGWRWLFIAEGAPAVILGIIVLFYLPDTPADAKWLTPAERDSIRAAVGADAITKKSNPGGIGEFVRAPFVLLALSYFTLVTSLNALSTWSPLIIREVAGKDASVIKIGLLAAIPGLIAAVVMPLLGASSDRKLERAGHYSIAALIAVAGWLLVAGTSTTAGHVTGLVLATAFGFGAMPILWTIPVLILTPRARPVGMAVLSAISILGSITSPAVVGFLRDMTGNFNAGIYYAAVLLTASAVMFFIAARPLRSVERASQA
jgi:ACS family 4-hydroxyphenylacetate permease-like MFS transporter